MSRGACPRQVANPAGYRSCHVRVNQESPDPTARILTCCKFGQISTLAAATLRVMGFRRAAALDGGMKAWRDAGLALAQGPEPGL